MANKTDGKLELLKGEGVELGLFHDNNCILYGLEGQCIAPDYGIWTGSRQALIERELDPMGLKVQDGKIVPAWEE